MADQPRYERLKAVKAAFEALTPEDVAALFKDGPYYEFMGNDCIWVQIHHQVYSKQFLEGTDGTP